MLKRQLLSESSDQPRRGKQSSESRYSIPANQDLVVRSDNVQLPQAFIQFQP